MKNKTLAPLVSFRIFAALSIVAFHTFAPKEEFLKSGVTFFYVLAKLLLRQWLGLR
jgi:hypothetical protein